MWTALAVAVLAYPAAWLVDRAAGSDVVLLQTVAPEDEIEGNRAAFDDTEKDPAKRRADVVGIYGSNPKPTVERVLFVDPAQVIVPKEDPSIVLLKPGAEYRYQAKSLYFLAQKAALAAAAAFVVLLVLRRFVK